MRRRLALCTLLAIGLPGFALAQAWPAKPIRVIVPFPPGGPTDVLGRLVGQALAEAGAASVVVENKTGAAGNIGVVQIAKAAPDGTTVGVVPAGNIAVNPALYPDLPYKASELAPVTLLAVVENVLVVNAETVPERTLKELLARGAARPGTLKRSALMPDLPTIAEQGVPKLEAVSWYALMAPAGTPSDMIDRLQSVTARALARPETREKLAALGMEAGGGSPAQLAATVQAETARWTDVVHKQNIKPE